MIEPGTVVERYMIKELVGQGGMASVYRAEHTVLGSEYALKLLEFGGKDIRDRIFVEGRLQAQLSHPNLLSVHDAFEYQGSPVLVMEWVAGPSLDQWLSEHTPDIRTALHLFRGIVRGVRYAHNNDIVHRDLKPGNILLSPTKDGFIPKVCDFGLAKIRSDYLANLPRATRTGTTMGTPEYQAPEQIKDASRVDLRADLFSLGVMLYELVCHQRPFQGNDVLELYRAVTTGAFIPLSEFGEFEPDLVDTIERLLKVDVEERIQSCQELLECLDGVAGGGRPPTPGLVPDDALPKHTPIGELFSTPDPPALEPSELEDRSPWEIVGVNALMIVVTAAIFMVVALVT